MLFEGDPIRGGRGSVAGGRLGAAGRWFSEHIAKHIATCRGVALEQTIALQCESRSPLQCCTEGSRASLFEVLGKLDSVLKLRGLRPLQSANPTEVVKWGHFVTEEGPRPLELLPEHAARLVRPGPIAKQELSPHRHRALGDFGRPGHMTI